jgi:hypothetical protein
MPSPPVSGTIPAQSTVDKTAPHHRNGSPMRLTACANTFQPAWATAAESTRKSLPLRGADRLTASLGVKPTNERAATSSNAQ